MKCPACQLGLITMPCICDVSRKLIVGFAEANQTEPDRSGSMPTLPQILLRCGGFILSRTDNGQLWLSDGVRGTVVDEAKFQKVLTNIMGHRWQF